jgi:CDP-diacylglycerol--glycerol-3-phosphate 3-phosphatidyltransferase
LIGSKIGHSLDPLLQRIYRVLFRKAAIRPNTLTLFGLFFSMLASFVLAATGRLLLTGILLVVSGFFDLLDGAVARNTNRVTRFGGFFDSVLDRYSDLLVMFGVSIYFLRQAAPLSSMAAFLAAIGIAIIPYARARAEAACIPCRDGLLERPERIILLSLGLLLHVLKPVVFILAVLTHVTVLQRILLVRKAARIAAPPPSPTRGSR